MPDVFLSGYCGRSFVGEYVSAVSRALSKLERASVRCGDPSNPERTWAGRRIPCERHWAGTRVGESVERRSECDADFAGAGDARHAGVELEPRCGRSAAV